MERLLQWGQDFPWMLTAVARQVVLAMPECHQLLTALRTGHGLNRLPPVPPINRWLPLYRHHGQVMNVLGEFLIPRGLWKRIGRNGEEVTPYRIWRELQAAGRKIARMSIEELREELASAGQEGINAGIQLSTALGHLAVFSDIDQVESDLDDRCFMPWRMQRLWKTPEMAFFLRVWFPCVLLYGESHTQLYARARRGCMRALEKLLRLDKSLIDDPKIAEIQHRLAHMNRERHKLIAKAFLDPIENIPYDRLKKYHAALISNIFGSAQVKLTAPEIRELFDAKEEAYSRGQWITDEDFSTGLEALAKDIQRKRAFWKVYSAMYPDKKCA